MSANEFHPCYPCSILHFHNKSIFVASNVEDGAVVAANARTPILIFNILGSFPIRLYRLVVPAL
jgi:hypothetical protein